ncbi:hypothetical protein CAUPRSCDRAFT_11417 [Caulochytrium protostelioides]|uniref:Uncharacterized protein n=1 Tax=Caulochytrium protostelioides TaxID=1555241 RepID=A0A4P9WWI0_9FUNG|nr:hypothetical protein CAUPRSCDRAFT_11417 [Caulochytrium protostelioides]
MSDDFHQTGGHQKQLNDWANDLMAFVTEEYVYIRDKLKVAIAKFKKHFPGKIPSRSRESAFLATEITYQAEKTIVYKTGDTFREPLPEARTQKAESVPKATRSTFEKTDGQRAIKSLI